MIAVVNNGHHKGCKVLTDNNVQKDHLPCLFLEHSKDCEWKHKATAHFHKITLTVNKMSKLLYQ